MSPPESRPRRNVVRLPKRTNEDFDAGAANAAMSEKLKLRSLQRTARAQGLELRHSDHGYALIDAQRQRVDGRNDLTLDEVAKHLKSLKA